jgi:hypothetical protein
VETRAHVDLEALGLDNWHEVEEADMTSCDYNGWNDAPEEEREWFDCHPELSLSTETLDLQRLPGVALKHSAAARDGGAACSLRWDATGRPAPGAR